MATYQIGFAASPTSGTVSVTLPMITSGVAAPASSDPVGGVPTKQSDGTIAYLVPATGGITTSTAQGIALVQALIFGS